MSFALLLPRAGAVAMRVRDVAGRAVRVTREAFVGSGRQVLEWDGRDDRGVRAAPGVYLAEISGSGFRASRRVVLLER